MFRRTLQQSTSRRPSNKGRDCGGSRWLFERCWNGSTTTGGNNRYLHQLFTNTQKEFLQQQQLLFQDTQQLAQSLQLNQIIIPNKHSIRIHDNHTNLLDSTFTVVMAGEFNAGTYVYMYPTGSKNANTMTQIYSFHFFIFF